LLQIVSINEYILIGAV